MLKTLGALAIGLAAGLIVATFALRDSDVGAPIDGASSSAISSGRSNEQLEALRAEVELRFATLDQRLGELAEEVETMRIGTTSGTAATFPAPSPEVVARLEETRKRLTDTSQRLAERMRHLPDPMGLFRVSSQSDRERLLAAGFTEQRIDWINRRSDELRMEALKAQYDTQRGEPRTLPAIALRNEMGDAEYERYLGALLGGGPTTVGVRQVLATSPAEQAGLQAGDEIVAYDGRRVATMAELNALSRDGKASESVVVEIRRNGQSMQLVVSRGPLGVSGSGLPALGP